MTEKPGKVLYENQNDIWEKAKEHLVEKLSGEPCVQEALVWASLAEGKFGVYEHEHAGREGSDIDLVIIVDEQHAIPESWGNTGVEKSCFDLYYMRRYIKDFEHEGHSHQVDGLVVFPSKHDLKKLREMLADRSKSIYLKQGEMSVLGMEV